MKPYGLGIPVRPNRILFVLLLSVCVLIAIFEATTTGTAASTGCPALAPDNKGWPKNALVYFDVSDLVGDQKTQARAALQKWTEANITNTSGVRFAEKSSSTPAATLIIKWGMIPGNHPGKMTPQFNPDGTIKSATIEIDVSDHAKILPDNPGYDSIFLKIVLHEVGHTMGLDDVPIPNPTATCGNQSSGKSVMNAQCGANDNGGNMPTRVKDCDNNTVKTNSTYTGGGGGGGDDGGGGGDDGTGGGGCTSCNCSYQTMYSQVSDPAELNEGCYRRYHHVDYICNGVTQWSSADEYDGVFCDPPLE